MQSGNPSATSDLSGSNRRSYLMLVGATLATLALLAGAGLGLFTAQAGRSRVTSVPPRPAVAAQVATTAQPALAYYLVGSPQDAAALQAIMLAVPALDSAPHAIAVVMSPEEQARMAQEIQSERQMLSGSDSPPIQLFDLRTPAEASFAPGSSATCVGPIPDHC